MSYETLLASQLESLVENQDVMIFDHRDARNYVIDHIPGALPMTDENMNRFLRERDFQRPVVVYCYHGISSRDMCTFLTRLGFNKVYNLEGGWNGWQNYLNSKPVKLSAALHQWMCKNGFTSEEVNIRIENGMTPLMYAALQGENSYLSELLANGASVDLCNDDGNNALWFACVNGDLETINILIEHGIDIDNQNVNGATALIYASSAGKYEVVRLLTENNANLHSKTHDDFTALDSAASLMVLRYLKQCYVS